mmetsp:Transcript_127355/g.220769  ORF Transcript_127355/g.220769 Transcript_127355/m.220769 type:complete len:471 (+) Transcript_127355:267-1679(+)
MAARTSTSNIVTSNLMAGSSPNLRQSSRFVKGSAIPKPSNFDGSGLVAIFWHPLSILLLCLPFGVVSYYLAWGKTLTFWLNFFAMVPLAKILGDATEELAAGLRNDMMAGLLNATFGNAVEMVIMIQTLRNDLFDVVKSSLLGSVLSNTLLVLGMSFFFGGIVNMGHKHPKLDQPALMVNGRSSSNVLYMDSGEDLNNLSREQTGLVAEKVQHFPVLSALVNTSMLLISCLSFSLVTVFRTITHGNTGHSYMDSTLLPVSRTCSLIIISSYVAYIIFQLVTHKNAMMEEDDNGAMSDGAEGGAMEDEDDEPRMSIEMALVIMFGTTVAVAYSSELLVRCIETVCEEAHISMHFIGIILIPIVGNACEHVAAIRFAMKDKPGLAIGIAIGSSTQVALFLVPMSVLVGWILDKDMDLNFGALNTTVMTLSVVVVLSMIVDGSSNWLQGYLLCAAYAVVSVLYFYLPNTLADA